MQELSVTKYKDTAIYMVNWFSAKGHIGKQKCNVLGIVVADIILKYFQISYMLFSQLNQKSVSKCLSRFSVQFTVTNFSEEGAIEDTNDVSASTLICPA